MKSLICVGVIAIALGGCTTIPPETTAELQLQSNPSEARATTSLGQSCLTPCALQESPGDEFTVSFQKEGFDPQAVAVTMRVADAGSVGFAGSTLLTSVIGLGTSAATEHALHPVQVVRVDLVAATPPRRAPAKPRPPAATAKPNN